MSMASRVHAELTAAKRPMDAPTLARRLGLERHQVASALSMMLRSRYVEVAATKTCMGGRRFYYVAKPKPTKAPPVDHAMRCRLYRLKLRQAAATTPAEVREAQEAFGEMLAPATPMGWIAAQLTAVTTEHAA